MTLPILVTAVFLALDFRMQIELNIETEQIVFQVSEVPTVVVTLRFTFDLCDLKFTG